MPGLDSAMYKIRLLKEASRNLEQLDKTVAGRIVRKMNWLAENVETMTPKGLRKNLSAYAKLREGNYRVIYQVLPEEEIIIVHFIGHRSEIYKNK